MSDELLPFYERELSFIRRLGARFAKDHPKIAGRLRLDPQGLAEDPHVERLIEAFAYLSARTRHKLEDEFPELTEALLGVLYPHYLAPIPSLATVQFELDADQKQLTTGHTIARGSQLETDTIDGEPCRFRTCYPVTLWPVAVREASLNGRPFTAPDTPHSSAAAAVLRLVLECPSDKLTFAELPLGSLRFFLKGQPQYVYRLYELILNNAIETVVANGPDDSDPVVLPADCLCPVGFEAEEGLLPYSARSFHGYRLLTEYFVFAEKFLFVDLTGLSPQVLSGIGNRLEIFIYLKQFMDDLEPDLTEVFRLGCTPIVNLYEQRAEPLQLSGTAFEYRIVPDARRPLAHEVYSIEKVAVSDAGGAAVEYRPFFSVKHALPEGAPEAFWHATRKPAENSEGEVDPGTEMYLSLVDLSFAPWTAADATLEVETVCLNRELTHRLPFGPDQPRLQLSEGGGLIGRISCLTPPTRTLRPAQRQKTLWRLISHLSLNHLSLVDNADGLREILKLYDFADNAETRKMIDGVVSVSSKRVVGRVRGPGGLQGQQSFCRGVEVTVCFDEDRSSGGVFLFASVLERFLTLYSTVNSFTRLVATVQGREGDLRRWQPRMGENVVI